MKAKNIAELKDKLEWLSTHNKNYTKEQYNKIEECLEIVKEVIKGV